MDSLVSAVRHAAIEALMLAEHPLTPKGLVNRTHQRLPQEVLLCARTCGMEFSVLQASTNFEYSMEDMRRSQGVLNGIISDTPSYKHAALTSSCSSSNRRWETITVAVLVRALLLLDKQFSITRGGHCVFPCLPSSMMGNEDVDALFSRLLSNQKLLHSQPKLQYRRCFSHLLSSSVRNVSESLSFLLRSNHKGVPMHETQPHVHAWLQKYQDVLTSDANRSVTFNSRYHQFRSSRQSDWIRDVQRPISHGIVATPISLKQLERLMAFHKTNAQKQRMSFRRWLELGLLNPIATTLEMRVSKDVGRARRAQHVVDEWLNANHDKEPLNPEQLRLVRVLTGDADITRRGRNVCTGAGLMVLPWDVSMLDGPHRTHQHWMHHTDDTDVYVFPSSFRLFVSNVLPIIRLLARPATSAMSSRAKKAECKHPLNSTSLVDLAHALLWSHEQGEDRACLWLNQYLGQFPHAVLVMENEVFLK